MKILIQTALSLEFNAIKVYLANPAPITHPVTSSTYEQGKYVFDGVTYDVLLVETGAGNARAADETGRAIDFFKPDFVFFVGIAGGLKDVKIGDVVASTKIIGYEVGKSDVDFRPRFDSIPSSYILEQIAKQVKRENSWYRESNVDAVARPDAFVQPIASGEKVVSSEKSAVFSYLKQFCSDAVAVDMEGSGFFVAARPYQAHVIEIRGISDLIENKAQADASGSQPLAASNAAAFTFSMINLLSKDNPIKKDVNSLEFKKKLVDELIELYPQGPEQNDIWARAGGDNSILVNSSSRRSQWYSAIDKLSLGGGGKTITMQTLINEVKADFPGFISTIF